MTRKTDSDLEQARMLESQPIKSALRWSLTYDRALWIVWAILTLGSVALLVTA